MDGAVRDVTTSVLIPVVDEPVDLFRDVLRRIADQRPAETIVVINGPRNTALEEVAERVRRSWRQLDLDARRPASATPIRVGAELAHGDVLVLVDSDTIWTDGTLAELVKPFADHRVGGVTTRQRILDPARCFITRWADWLENSRAKYSMPAQSVLGQVGCLPGRTIAFRREVVERAMERVPHRPLPRRRSSRCPTTAR